MADGLLETEPPQGWPKLPGAVLDYDTALRQLARRRLNITGDALDTTELLILTSADFAGLDRLRLEERTGLEQWLAHGVGPAAAVLLTLGPCWAWRRCLIVRAGGRRVVGHPVH
ncbi:hypothetical protein [Salinispora arenicola]|uniref:hypothetical protein n=1 Tax=Salinispora arenicola TaxID=168697 RepID=UPI0016A208C8|nr:hypothetical protein [Salinispora arenicola]NIL64669.1 hypothetical protein [Salinispora arenicola]